MAPDGRAGRRGGRPVEAARPRALPSPDAARARPVRWPSSWRASPATRWPAPPCARSIRCGRRQSGSPNGSCRSDCPGADCGGRDRRPQPDAQRDARPDRGRGGARAATGECREPRASHAADDPARRARPCADGRAHAGGDARPRCARQPKRLGGCRASPTTCSCSRGPIRGDCRSTSSRCRSTCCSMRPPVEPGLPR